VGDEEAVRWEEAVVNCKKMEASRHARENDKSVKRTGIGRGVPIPSRIEGLAHIVSSPNQSGVRGTAPIENRVLVHFELELTDIMTTDFFVDTFVTHKHCLYLKRHARSN